MTSVAQVVIPEANQKFIRDWGRVASRIGAPMAVEFEVTYRCNHVCEFCYNVWKEDDPREWYRVESDTPKMLAILEKICDSGVFSVLFTGGEPMLRRDIFILMQYVRDRGIEANIVTNGSRIKEPEIEMLKKVANHVQVSLHASTPEIMDKLVGRKGAWKDAVESAKALREAGVSVNFNVALTKENFRELPAMFELAKSIDVDLRMTRLVSTGFGVKNWRHLVLSHEELMELIGILHKAGKDGYRSIVQTPLPPCAADGDERQMIREIYQYHQVIRCAAGFTWCAVNPEGDVRYCSATGGHLGNVMRTDLKQIWNTAPIFKQVRAFKHVPVECLDCDDLPICSGGCRAATLSLTGEFTRMDPMALSEVASTQAIIEASKDNAHGAPALRLGGA